MSFESEFAEFMPNTVTLEPFSTLSTDGRGSRTYGTSVSFKARIEQRRRLVRDNQGREVMSQTTVYVPPTTTAGAAVTVNVSDRLTLPSGFLVAGSSQPPMIWVERQQDETGNHHYAMYL